MTIAEVREKCKNILARMPRDVLVFSLILTAAGLGFGSGFLAGKETGQGSAGAVSPAAVAEAAPNSPAAEPGQVVASKNGTKYYLPTCSGASRISEKNKVWFPTAAAARAQGYTPAANCKGLE